MWGEVPDGQKEGESITLDPGFLLITCKALEPNLAVNSIIYKINNPDNFDTKSHLLYLPV